MEYVIQSADGEKLIALKYTKELPTRKQSIHPHSAHTHKPTCMRMISLVPNEKYANMIPFIKRTQFAATVFDSTQQLIGFNIENTEQGARAKHSSELGDKRKLQRTLIGRKRRSSTKKTNENRWCEWGRVWLNLSTLSLKLEFSI